MAIEPGERVPNFRRVDQSGKAPVLYRELHHGQPIVLIVLPKTPDDDATKRLAALNTATPAWERISRIGLIAEPPERCSELAEEYDLAFPLLADDGSLIAHLVGTPSPDSITAVALDRNLRMLERIDGSEPGFLTRLLTVYQSNSSETPEVVSTGAPVLLIPRVFEPDYCDHLIEVFEKDGGHPSGVLVLEDGKEEWAPDPKYKDRRDMELVDEALQVEVRGIIGRRVLPEIEHCFNYRVDKHETFKMICYEAASGGYFRPHRDNVTADAAHRRFAMTLNLNTGDYDGGELVFPEYGNQRYAPEKGGAIIFSCSLVHEARDVTRGRRYAMLGFFFDHQAEAMAKQPQSV